MAFALHYRQAPDKEALVRELAEGIAADHPEFKLQPGKCVFELKPAAASKGEAIARFLELEPFAGCLPVFLVTIAPMKRGSLSSMREAV